MNAVKPPPQMGMHEIVLAENQAQYDPLPCLRGRDGLVITEWSLTAEELAALVNGGRIRLSVFTFNHPFQPVRLEVVE